MGMFDDFNEMFNVEELSKEVASAAAPMEFVDVPYGDYEVAIGSMELGRTSEKAKNPNQPKATVRFEIVAGEYKGQSIFMNQSLTHKFGFIKMNEFLESLETGISIGFQDFNQYADLLKEVFNEVDGKAEYQLRYEENDKGFATYTIMQRF